MKLIALLMILAALTAGCGGETDQEKYNRMKNDQLGREQQQKQLEDDKRNPRPTEVPEATEVPTPTPRDSLTDIIYTNHGTFSVTYGKGELGANGVLTYKTVEVTQGDDEPVDIIWLMPSGVVVVSEKYRNRVKKIQ